MSASCLRIFMLGIKLPRDRLIKEDHVRGCEHPPVDGAKFCSQCGSPTWTPREAHQFYDSDNIGQFTVRTREQWLGGQHSRVAYIGLEIKGEYVAPLKVHDWTAHMDLIKAELEAELAKHHIEFDETDPFGLHLVAELC